MQPAAHRSSGAVGYHIQQPATLQVDQTGDPSGGCQADRLEEVRLVQAERSYPVQAGGVLHQRGAVVSHRPHDGRPANPQVTGDRGDRMGVLADPPAGLSPGPLGQHRSGADRGCLLGPGADPTRRLWTAPQALAPPEHHRPASERQVTHQDPAAAMELGPHPTALTADHGGGGLDLELPLTGRDLRGEDLEAVEAEQDRP